MLSCVPDNLDQLIGGQSLQAWSQLFIAHMQTLDDQFDPGHRIDHVLRVTRTAIQLAQEEGAALDIVLPAAMLHDTKPVGKFDQDRALASTWSAEQTISLLVNWSYPAEYYPAIKHAILAHSFSAKITPLTLEAKVVQDADRLDALGAIGISRTIAAGFNHGNPLYLYSEPFPRQRSANDQTNVLDHFYIKLFRLPESFHTQSAKIEGARRIRTMENYLQELAHEVGANYLSYDDYCDNGSSVPDEITA